MATFGGLFDFPDLSDGQSELSSPPDSSDDHSDEYTEDEEDAWYNLPSDSDDSDDDSAEPVLPLPASSTAFILATLGPKEYSTGARIKAIYMLEDKKSLGQIRKATEVPRSAVYRLAAVARERGWVENKNMPLEVLYILNAPRSGRPAISAEAIKCILKVVLQNSTTRGFSCTIIAKEVKKRGYKIAPRTIWKVLTYAGYSQYKLTVKPGLNELNKAERLAWCLEREH
jgi:transposase